MIVMFILMALPIIAIPVFWLLPPFQAVPVYRWCLTLILDVLAYAAE
jgi:hypothetical protein